MERKEILFKLALTAIFAALCFGLTYVNVPLPTGGKVHLGNFACVLAALLCGGVIGGVAGSLGMGLNDIVTGYIWTTTLRTFITKFFLGFIVGLLFQILINRKKATKITLYSLTGLFFGGFLGSLIAYVNGSTIYSYKVVKLVDGVEKTSTVKTLVYDASYSTVLNAKGFNITIGGTTKLVEMSILVPIFMGILAVLLIGVTAFVLYLSFTKKNEDKTRIYTVVATVTSISILVNTFMEFFVRIILVGITNGVLPATAEAITKIPSNLTTGVATLVCVTLVYLPIYLALTHAGYSKYIVSANLEAEKEESELVVEA